MTRQQEAREALRSAWSTIFTAVFPMAVNAAQTAAFAARAVAKIWPVLAIDDLKALDRADAALLQVGTMDRAVLNNCLIDQIAQSSEPLLTSTCPDNPHARGGRLRTLVQAELVRRTSELAKALDDLFEAEGTDRLAEPQAVKARVLAEISNRILTELISLKPADSEVAPKRRLKALTALATPGGDREHRDSVLANLGDGNTAGFPYLLKYITRDAVPQIHALEAIQGITTDGFSGALESLLPEAAWVRACLERYQGGAGILEQFVDATGIPSGDLTQKFENLPSFIPAKPNGILMPKAHAFEQNRHARFRMPDGVVCALGMSSLIESILRQAVSAFGLGPVVSPRAATVIKRLCDASKISQGLAELLKPLFDQRSLAVRDALSHGAFFADDPVRLHNTIGVLSEMLKLLVAELEPAGILSKQRWDFSERLSAADIATIDQQFEPGLNLADQLLDDDTRKHIFAVTKALVPDKRMMAWAGFLLWVSGQHDAKTSGNSDPVKEYVALMANLCVVEELFRAIYEIHGRRIMIITPDGNDRARCELAMLDDNAGHLLAPAAITAVFPEQVLQKPFQDSIAALRSIRDKALHGIWAALPGPMSKYAHLVVKLLATLCSTCKIGNS